MNTIVFRKVGSLATILLMSAGVMATFAFAGSASAQVQPSCSIYTNTVSGGPGQPVTLVWSSTNATSASLTNVGSVTTAGSQIVYPSVTTTYILTVTSGSGLTSTCQTTVNVGSTSGVPSCSITAGTTNQNPGSPVTLSWNSTNASSATLTNIGSVSTNGSQVVYPSVTTTYTLTVTNYQGQTAQCQTTAYVSGSSYQTPSCWINLSQYNQYNQYNNQQATLSWGSTNATSATINPSVGSVGTSGSQIVYPYGNQIYTMTVYNAQGQSATCQTSYVSSGNVYCSITATPMNIQNGSSAYLSWTSTGATSAWLSDGLGNVAPNGSLTVRPETSRNYTLTVTGVNGTQTCNTYVTVSGYYVPLNHIPYTGFDLGPVGNTVYWFVLAFFAVAAGYSMVYFMPKYFSFSTRSRSARAYTVPEARIISERVITPAIFAEKNTKI